MVVVTVSLPDAMKDWVEAQIGRGHYASASDYIGELVRRDHAQREQELTLEELQQKLAASRKSGASGRSVDDIFAEARVIAETRGLRDG